MTRGGYMRKLPVFKSFKEVFAGVTHHYFDLIRIAPGGVGLLLSGYLVLIISGDFPGMTDEKTVAAGSMFDSLPRFVTFAAACIAIYIGSVAAAVRWHRFVLLGELPRGAISALFFWGKDQFRYLWTTMKLGFVLVLISGFALLLVAFA